MTEGQNARKEEGKPKKHKEQKPYGGKDLGLRFKDKGRALKETVAYKNGEWMPKSQVTIEYRDGRPSFIPAVVVSTQHDPDVSYDVLRRDVIEKIIRERR